MVVVLAVVFLAAFVGWVVWNNVLREQAPEPVAIATDTPSAVVEPVPVVSPDSASKTPNLDWPVKVVTKLPDAVATNAIKRIRELTDELRNNKDLYSSWLELASNRKLIGDYTAAEEIWIYVTQNWSDDPIAYSNLADLYLMVHHDNERAETYLLRAIKRDPGQVMFYENAYSFYRFVKKNLPQAQGILEEGIGKNPRNAEGLKQLLADLQSVL